MSYHFEEECFVHFDFEYKQLGEWIILQVLEFMSFPYEAEVSLTLTDNEGIHQINKSFRDIDSATDVLSFPMLSYKAPGDFSFLEQECEDDFNPDTGEALLGDIIISVEKVKTQAMDYGHSEKREYAFLIVHSMLHLLGYDHMEKAEADMMEKIQDDILKQLNILR